MKAQIAVLQQKEEMLIRKRWDREEELSVPVPSASIPEPAKVISPMSTAPAVRSYEVVSPRSISIIGKAVYVKGQIIAHEDLRVDGQIEGTVEALEHRVTIGSNGRVAAAIRARHIIIQGQVTGNVEASEKIEICNGARLQGDVRTVKFVCEEEATFNGSVSIVRPEPRITPVAVEKKETPVDQAPLAPTRVL